MDNSNMLTPASNRQAQSHENYANIGGLNDLKQQAREDQASALKPVAAQFEAIFVQQMLQEARKVSFDEGWLDGNQGDFYKDWSDKQLAQDVAAKGTLGFADNIVKQLSPHIPEAQAKLNAALSEQSAKQQGGKSDQIDDLPVKSTEQALALRFMKQSASQSQ